MAKIPRINQGDRPSGVYSPTLDASVSNMIGALGDVSGEFLQTATAEEQAGRAAEKAERVKMAAALDEKQKIVDASNAGIVALEMDERNAQTLAALEAQYPNDPDKIPPAYLEITGKWPQEVIDREDLNDRVKLDAAKRLESTRVSGYKQAQSISSSLKTVQVKGNLARKETAWIAAARSAKTEQGLRDLFAAVNADPDYRAVHGNSASDEQFKQEKKMVQAQLVTLSAEEPQTALALLKNPPKFYDERIDDTAPLVDRAERDALDFANRDELATVSKQAKTKGVLVKAALKGEFDAATVSTERERIVAAIENVPNERQLSKDAKEKKRGILEQELKDLTAIEILQSRNLDNNYVGEDTIPAPLIVQREELFDTENGKMLDKGALVQLLTYERNIMAAVADKKIRPGRATTLLNEVALSRDEAIAAAVNNTGGFFSRDDVQAGQRALKEEIANATNQAGLSPEMMSAVTERYISDYVKATESAGGKVPPREEAVKIARRAYYRVVTKWGEPQGLR
jgi:hypothetical protein